ncbi:MAG: cyaJ [Rhizobium sp.]|nr:cyaJ [Rhizobium sp.]
MMTETRRKLTTIFSADVQDYTRLMGADEEGTLATLKRYRDLMGGLIVAHGGRVINTWGDGLIAEFPSVVEAVRTAVDVQNELAGQNATRPTDGRMLFRIGINLGDVMVDGDDIYGDGVNIAARLQASAPAGGIVISSTVYDQVRNKVAVGFDFLGDLAVKNVSEGVPSYAVLIGEAIEKIPKERPRDTYRSQPESQTPAPSKEELFFPPGSTRMYGALGVAAIVLAVINLLTSRDSFWAKWPITVFAFIAALQWARTQHRFDRRTTALIVMGLGVVAINFLSWSGTFWAQWPLLGIAIAIAIRWFGFRR